MTGENAPNNTADNVIYLPIPRELTAEQRQYWFGQAAYWGVLQDEAGRHREDALRMLGMVAEQGVEG